MSVLLLGSDPGWMRYLVVPRMEVEHAWLVQFALFTVSLAYFGIVAVLAQVFVHKRDLALRIVITVLALLFLWRGMTQLLSIWIFHHPEFRANLAVQGVSALLSTAAVAALLWALPILHRMPTPAQLEEETTARKRLEEAAQEAAERFRNFVESTQDYAMYMLDLEGMCCRGMWDRSGSRAIVPRRL